MFWEQGVAATSGDQIADAVGLSTRTLWRTFRNKESCAEPILAHTARRFLGMLRRWPDELSIEEHFALEVPRLREDPETPADDLPAMKMIVLGLTEPAIRTAWLMVCDAAERDLCDIIAARLRRRPDELDVRLHAAAVAASVRVVNEDVSAAVLTPGTDPGDTTHRVIHAIRTATHGALGDPVISAEEPHEPAQP